MTAAIATNIKKIFCLDNFSLKFTCVIHFPEHSLERKQPEKKVLRIYFLLFAHFLESFFFISFWMGQCNPAFLKLQCRKLFTESYSGKKQNRNTVLEAVGT